MKAPEIRVKGLCKSFGDNKVLKDLEITLEAGKVNFIIGRSGGGKSVLLKHLTGLLTPDSGEVWYGDREFFRAGKREKENLRKSVGLLFQDGALFDSLSAGENVIFPLWYHRAMPEDKAKERALSLLKDLGMEGAYDHRVEDLSGGEKKRVAIARALVMEPGVLFFDEPTTGLDPILSTQVDALILEARERTGATVAVVSHDIAAALSISDRIHLLHEGRVLLSGTAFDFKKSDLPEVKAFLTGDEPEGP
ncbi:MAG: ATP-binding cassette domain-containing protein [Deltaproteobacteria bacterium]|jgi:phospholipid/cholesterol/gamma-HCH transport system ATP-binding protein|nr:ATP-binding cassette domain-containing protein [Deltaproteobacteria bacterium]